MATTVDSNEVRVTGENSFIRLALEEGGEFTTRASHWRVLYSPAGPGHALFLTSELTDNEIAIYSDNIALARWLQEEIESMLHPPFADTDISVIEAEFEQDGDVRSFITERIAGEDFDITMTWYDICEPRAIHAPPGFQGRSHGVYTVFFPAQRAQLSINGDFATGRPVRADKEDWESTSACLAWAESWIRPRQS